MRRSRWQPSVVFRSEPAFVPDLDQGRTPVAGGAPGTTTEGSVSLFVDDDVVRVVLLGAIGHDVHQDVHDLVDDLVSDAAASAHRPVSVLAWGVTQFGLQGVWLLLELRRAARPAAVTLVDPSGAVRLALELHGLTSFLPAGDAEEGAEALQA
jgi:hypothetical protein